MISDLSKPSEQNLVHNFGETCGAERAHLQTTEASHFWEPRMHPDPRAPFTLAVLQAWSTHTRLQHANLKPRSTQHSRGARLGHRKDIRIQLYNPLRYAHRRRSAGSRSEGSETHASLCPGTLCHKEHPALGESAQLPRKTPQTCSWAFRWDACPPEFSKQGNRIGTACV